MPSAVLCSQCQAPVTDDRWISCPYCAALLVKPVLNPNKAVVAAERFLAVERSPEFDRWIRHTPDASAHETSLGLRTLFLAVFCLGTLFITIVVAVQDGAGAFIPALMFGVALWWLVRHLRRAREFSKAPLDRRIVVWRDERTQVSGGGENSPARTTHFALLESRDGERVEFQCNAELAGGHAPGDIGIAYLRGGILLEFKRVAV